MVTPSFQLFSPKCWSHPRLFSFCYISIESISKSFLKLIFIAVSLLYNVVWVSAMQQSESAIHIPMSTLVWVSFPLRSLQNFEFPVLYNRFSLLPYFIQSSVYMSTPISQFIPPLFPAWYSYTCTLQLCLYFCFANKFIYTIFLDSTYKWHYTIFVFLFLTYFTLYVGP